MSKKLVYLASFVLVLGLAGRGWSDASNPSPDDGAIYKDTWAALSWQPGEHAASFDIYIGDNYEDVKNGAGDTFRGNQNDTFFIVGFFGRPYPDGLVPGTTYYWRIDEVNDLHPDSPWVGEVWSFKITPYTAYAPEPVDSAEFVDPNVILSWQPGFHAKLHYVVFGEDFDEVNKASEGHPQGDTTYNPDILEMGKTYYWRIDESDGSDTYKGDVWSFTVGAAAPPVQEPPNTTVKVIYVDADAVGANNGSDWTNAYQCLQNALEEASLGDEIRVAKGIYQPDRRIEKTGRIGTRITASGARIDTFQMPSGVTIKGGYAGFAAVDPDARDINQYKTILSGDLSGDDTENLNDPGSEASRAENSYHVVTASGVDETAVLDGFTITGGNANIFTDRNGGGLLNEYGSPQIINCTFIKNSAQYYGGGIYNYYGSTALANCTFTQNLSGYEGGGIYNYQSNLNINNCTFEENLSHRGGGIRSGHGSLSLTDCTFIGNLAQTGAGINSYAAMETGTNETDEDSLRTPVLINCIFTANSAEHRGGGLYSSDSNPSLKNCIFSENTAGNGGGGLCFDNSEPNLTGCSINKNLSYYGGGMYNDNSSLSLTYCKLIANEGYDYGGGMYNVGNSYLSMNNCLISSNRTNSYGGGISNNNSDLALTNCTFSQNSARNGSAVAFNSQEQLGKSNAGIFDCILWDDGEIIWINDQSIIEVSYTDVKGGWPGTGNIDADPLFADPNGPDGIPGTEDDDLQLAPSSPCVDAGDPNYAPGANKKDIDSNPRLAGGRVDMGAYECQGIIYVDNKASDGSGQDSFQPDGSTARPFYTIQEAIDVAKDGQTVLVRPGVYSNIDFMGKAITVAGTNGAAMIDTTGDGLISGFKQDAVTFHTGEGTGSVLKNFILRNNRTAISLNYGSSPTITNLTIIDNDFGISAYENSNPDISNCIFWNNRDGDLFQCEARFSCFEIEIPGTGNISGDPLFVDPNNGDYHLMSEGWRWSTYEESWTWDFSTSPCIDAGDPAMPLGDEPMSISHGSNNEYGMNLRINMGAYGGTCQASIPPLGWLPQVSETAEFEELSTE